MITQNNYEEYFLRYCEGELDEADRRAVERYAEERPEVADELALYDASPRLQREPISFPGAIPGLDFVPMTMPKVTPLPAAPLPEQPATAPQQQQPTHPLFLRYAAAVVLLLALVGVALLFQRGNGTEEAPRMAQQKPILVDEPTDSARNESERTSSPLPAPAATTPATQHIASAPTESLAPVVESSAPEYLAAADVAQPVEESFEAAPAAQPRARLIVTDQLICFLPAETPSTETEQPAPLVPVTTPDEPLLADARPSKGSWNERARRISKLSVSSLLVADRLYERFAPRAEQLYNQLSDSLSKYDIFS